MDGMLLCFFANFLIYLDFYAKKCYDIKAFIVLLGKQFDIVL